MALYVRGAAISARTRCRIGRPPPRRAPRDHPRSCSPSRLTVISMPRMRSNVCARRSRPASNFPEAAGNLDRVSTGLSPPCALITRAMHCTMMPATEWDCELIAHLAAERAWLGKSEVMRVRGLAAADEARLLGDIAQMLAVAVPAACGSACVPRSEEPRLQLIRQVPANTMSLIRHFAKLQP